MRELEILSPDGKSRSLPLEGERISLGRSVSAELSYPDESFDSAGCFTMLHHVPTLALQNKILAEAFRVLRPGGVLIGSDSLASTHLHEFHEADTYNPVEPASLLPRLQTLGFSKVTVIVDDSLLFIARKVTPDESCGRDDQ